MKTKLTVLGRCRKQLAGLTLAETLTSLAIVVVTIGGTVNGYLLSTNRAEWSAQSLAAHSMAIQRLEQVRAAKWDSRAYPPVDLVTQANFQTVTNIMDIPVSGTNIVAAIVYTTISSVSSDPPLKLIRVDCVWPYMRRGFFTNAVVSYRAPDQ